MPILTNFPLSETSHQLFDDKDLIDELHSELIMMGHAIDHTEFETSKFGPSTAAAASAVETQFGFAANGQISPLLGRITRAARMVVSGNLVDLGPALIELAPMAADAPGEVQLFIGRFAAIAGDYALAREFASRMDASPEADALNGIIGKPGTPPGPVDLALPENFYTYRYQPFGNDTDAIVHELLVIADGNQVFMMRRIAERERDGDGEQDLPPPVDPPPPPAQPEIDISQPRVVAVQQAALGAAKAIAKWQEGNSHFKNGKYKLAVLAYSSCEIFARTYFDRRYDLEIGSDPIQPVAHIDNGGFLANHLAVRSGAITLSELKELDWQSVQPLVAQAILARDLLGKEINPLADGGPAIQAEVQASREASWDRILFLLIRVFVPMARAEANRMQRQFDPAISDLRQVLGPSFVNVKGPIRMSHPVFGLCEFIERPFVQILLAETLLDKAEAQYKSRLPVSADGPLELQAEVTYQSVMQLFGGDGTYGELVEQGLTQLQKAVKDHVTPQGSGPAGVSSISFRAVAKDIYLPSVTSAGGGLPGLSRKLAPHSSLLVFNSASPHRAANPRIFALLLAAQARLAQIGAGFNYLGYTDDYTPPWRFQFLLDRTRYFAEHAKNAQRDYLNFLNNAENAELQELSASQTVVMEKSNVRIEGARVDQVDAEVKAPTASRDLADTSASDAQIRIDSYAEFSKHMLDLEQDSSIWGKIGKLAGAAAGVAAIVATGGAAAPIVIGAVGTMVAADANMHQDLNNDSKTILQRNLEKQNLGLAKDEAAKAADVAAANLKVAEAGLIVAGLQRQAALLRHEFALQTLLFLQSQTLNAEQWYRLAASIRSIADTYLRYAIELGFLTEQAYEFEADRQINVMRFDYDQSEVGNFLAADFLLRDLDTLEQDLLVSQKQRQQQVKYTVSMARDFPAALQELREKGSVTFALPLEQIERRFPGLYNARLGAVDVMPIALFDATRFSMELTHMGSGTVRRRAQPGDASDSLPATPPPTSQALELATEWKRLTRVNGPETTIFSGLSRQEAGAVFPFMTNGQRNAFEGRPAASAWQVDMAMKENQVVPGTLVDLLFTFTLSGYQDSRLRTLVEETSPTTNVVTSYLSARQIFPDAFYDFNRTGRMVWKVAPDMLALNGEAGRLRNIGVILIPAADRIHFGRLSSRYSVDFEIAFDGTLEVLSEIPKVKFTVGAQNSLAVSANVEASADLKLSWDFGDGSAMLEDAATGDHTHTYAKPGIYTVTLRIVRAGRLSEFRAQVSVSRTHELKSPVTDSPRLSATPGIPATPQTPTTPASTAKPPRLKVETDASSGLWAIAKQPTRRGQSADFDLEPGKYTLNFMSQHPLKAHLFGNQRHVQDRFEMQTLSLTTNRKFSDAIPDGIGADANDLTKLLFSPGEISPADDWTFEIGADDNPFLKAATGADIIAPDLAMMQDVVLVVESELQVV